MPRIATWTPPKLTPWQLFKRDPAVYLARWIHALQPPVNPQDPGSSSVTIICISDTHMAQPDVPDGDVLLHAGDLTNCGTFEELQAHLDWLSSLPHRYKVIIAGNHGKLLDADYVKRFPDRICEEPGKCAADLNFHDLIYLDRTSVTLRLGTKRTLKIFGSPMTPECGVFGFQYPPIRDVWKGIIPEGTDILLTHGPPKGYLDLMGKGCQHLTRAVGKARPSLVVFGHTHAGRGRLDIDYRVVEKGYQSIMAGDGGLLTVLWMALALITAWMLSLAGNGVKRKKTTLVNAAISAERNLGATFVHLQILH